MSDIIINFLNIMCYCYLKLFILLLVLLKQQQSPYIEWPHLLDSLVDTLVLVLLKKQDRTSDTGKSAIDSY